MENLITKTDAKDLLGISLKKFNLLGIEPARITKNPYKRSAFMYLYRSEEILELKDSEQIAALKPKAITSKDYTPSFEKRYKDKEDAIQDVCFGLFNLNRYTKHKSCAIANKEEIYSLKTDLIQYLYSKNYCTSVQLHRQSGCTREWFNRDTNEYEEGYDWENNLYSFTFDILGTTYSWHQPEEEVGFHIDSISTTKEIGSIVREKPLTLNPAKFKEAKELIRWFVKTR